jgi:hypothetical protein
LILATACARSEGLNACSAWLVQLYVICKVGDL